MSLTCMSLSAYLILTLLLIFQNTQTGRTKPPPITTDTCSTATCRNTRLTWPNHQKDEVFNYLKRYGYLDETWKDVYSTPEASFTEGIRKFQQFFKIPESGTIDGATIEGMRMPRCGNRDILGMKPDHNIRNHRWQSNNLTYRIFNYPSIFPVPLNFSRVKHLVDTLTKRAFNEWSQVANINFQCRRRGEVDIEIRFAKGEHGCVFPFDGLKGQLGHTFEPPYGDIHFDDDEYWFHGVKKKIYSTHYYMTVLHHIGHAVGLNHSTNPKAIMSAKESQVTQDSLNEDDILAAVSLYGPRGTKTNN